MTFFSMVISGTGWEPEREEARRLLHEELARPEYADARPPALSEWLGRALEALFDWLGSASLGGGTFPGWILLVLLGVLVVVLVVWLRPRRSYSARNESTIAVTEQHISAAQYRQRAMDHLAETDFSAATQLFFQAIVREAEERVLLNHQPGTTATEASRTLGQLFPAEQQELERASQLFNAVVYGGRTARQSQAQQLAALDERLRTSPSPLHHLDSQQQRLVPR